MRVNVNMKDLTRRVITQLAAKEKVSVETYLSRVLTAVSEEIALKELEGVGLMDKLFPEQVPSPV